MQEGDASWEPSPQTAWRTWVKVTPGAIAGIVWQDQAVVGAADGPPPEKDQKVSTKGAIRRESIVTDEDPKEELGVRVRV